MIRVLNILETISSGGVERRRLSLAKLLDKSKFELKIICTHSDGELPGKIRENGVEVIPIGNLDGPFHYSQHKKVQQIIDEFQPHIIHGAVFEGVTMAAVNGFIKKVPVVILEETSDPQNRSWKGNLLMKLFSFAADKVVGVSPAATEYLTDTVGISAKKVQLINNGVAMPRIVLSEEKELLKRQLGIQNEDVVIGSIGRMLDDNHKRFSDLISAFHVLVKEDLPVKLVLVGDGPLRAQYQQQVKSLGLEEKVVFAGYQDDVALYYSILDIFTLVSAFEAFGLVLPEAMLHKLSIVATNVGGMRYIVDHEETGFLVESKNVSQITEALKKLVTNEEMREAFGENGYNKASELFTEERYVKEVARLYEEVFHKKGLV